MVISHEKALNRMMKGTPGLAALTGDALPGSSFFTPEKDFYANGEAVQLLYQPQAHSDGDVMVFFRGPMSSAPATSSARTAIRSSTRRRAERFRASWTR